MYIYPQRGGSTSSLLHDCLIHLSFFFLQTPFSSLSLPLFHSLSQKTSENIANTKTCCKYKDLHGMDPSSAQHQEMPDHMLENMMVCLKGQPDSRKPRPQPEQALKCPRCDSTNTKFCYYNNYSLSQPRYFCKSCRRYWTKGGTLRNVPVGGGCRRNKRSSSSSSSASSSSSKRTQDQQPAMTPNMTNPSLGAGFPSLSYDSPNDLSLAFARLQKQSCGQLGFDDEQDFPMGNAAGFLGSLRNGFLDNQSVFPNMYYNGYDNNGSLGEADINGGEGVGIIREMAALQPYEELGNYAATTAVTVTTMKQELCSSGRENENRVWWGFPWQLNANGMSIDALDSGRESWNGIAPSSWHGLINSPLL